MRVLPLPVATLLGIQLTQGQDLKTGLKRLPTLRFTKNSLGKAPSSPRCRQRQPTKFARVPKLSLCTTFFEVYCDADKTALPLPEPSGFSGAEGVQSSFFKTTNTEISPIALRPEELLAALEPAHAEALTANTRQQQLNLEPGGDVVRLLAYHYAL